MKATSRSILVVAPLLAVVLLGGSPVVGQDDAEEPEYDGHWYFDIEAFYAQPAGGELFPASQVNPDDALDTKALGINYEANSRGRYRFGYKFSGKGGAIIGTWYAQEGIQTMSLSSPGQFIYGELNIAPYYAGLFLDGMADGFDARADLLLRDFRLDYYREAFSNPRVTGRWFAGLRRVFHRRSLETWYLAQAPGLGPLLAPASNNPRPDLMPGRCGVYREDETGPGCEPVSDYSLTHSDVEFRGVEAGFDIDVTLLRRRLFFNAGFAVAVGRGRQTTNYKSTTYRYELRDGGRSGPLVRVLVPPYDEFNEYTGGSGFTGVVENVAQVELPLSMNTVNESASSAVIETFLGFTYRPWRTLDIRLGFRQTRYEDIGVVVMPSDASPTVPENPDKTTVWNLQDDSRNEYSMTYEGYYLGVSYLF